MKTLLCALALLAATAAAAQDKNAGKAVYDSVCSVCHATGVVGAPKPGDAAAWGPRAKGGLDALVKSAIAGTTKGMPPRGGRPDLTDAQLRAAIEYMAGAALPQRAAAAATPTPTPPKPAVPAPPAAKPAAAAATSATLAAAAPPAPPPSPAAAPAAAVAAAAPPPSASPAPTPVVNAEVNAFNRLLRPAGRINRPAAESGIHDPTNDATLQLQPPAQAFATLPKASAGNHVDWVKALGDKSIDPRWDRNDPKAAAVVMDLNIVREVKGSMPDVVYPHKQHTEWLDCANCHPSIFIPQKGANQISMASILLGQKCGVCHGKVAFPVSECRLCHSRKKTDAAVAEKKP
jgi:c(7)-type cytochrome triheme protein